MLRDFVIAFSWVISVATWTSVFFFAAFNKMWWAPFEGEIGDWRCVLFIVVMTICSFVGPLATSYPWKENP